MKKLSIEHPFFEFMGNIGDWAILNVLFVITSLPVITVGMTMTAMYKVALRRVRGESRYAAREYLQACREEWRQGTRLWIFFLITGGILLFDVLYGKNLWRLLNVAIGVLVVLWCFTFTYAFPLQARFQNSVKNILMHALFLAFRNLPFTIVMVILNGIPILCIAAGAFTTMISMPVFCAIGFSLITWINSLFLTGIFQKLIGREDKNENKAWDISIGQAVNELGDDKITQYLFERNGTGTPGHLRIPEAEEMAGELARYIESLNIDGWE